MLLVLSHDLYRFRSSFVLNPTVALENPQQPPSLYWKPAFVKWWHALGYGAKYFVRNVSKSTRWSTSRPRQSLSLPYVVSMGPIGSIGGILSMAAGFPMFASAHLLMAALKSSISLFSWVVHSAISPACSKRCSHPNILIFLSHRLGVAMVPIIESLALIIPQKS